MLKIRLKCFVLTPPLDGPLHSTFLVLPSFTQRCFQRENPQTACSFRPLPWRPRSSARNSQHGVTRILCYETFSSAFRLKRCAFNPPAVHSPCSFANLHLETPHFLVWAAQGFSKVRASLCSHIFFVMPPHTHTLSSVGFSLSMLVSLPI